MGSMVKAGEAKELGFPVPENRIVFYKLEELAYRLYLEGYSDGAVASKCNEELAKRPGNEQYVEISPYVVNTYLKHKRKEIDTNVLADTSVQQRVLPDVGEKLNQMVMMLESELEKLRVDKAPVSQSREEFFIKLIDRMEKFVSLSANIQGKIGPSVQIAVFSQNIHKFVKRVEEMNIAPEIKGTILDAAATELVTNDIMAPQTKDVAAKDPAQ